MKVTKPTTPKFQPVSLTLTFDTQKELDTFGSLFNHSKIASVLRSGGIEPAEIYTAVADLGGDISGNALDKIKSHIS